MSTLLNPGNRATIRPTAGTVWLCADPNQLHGSGAPGDPIYAAGFLGDGRPRFDSVMRSFMDVDDDSQNLDITFNVLQGTYDTEGSAGWPSGLPDDFPEPGPENGYGFFLRDGWKLIGYGNPVLRMVMRNRYGGGISNGVQRGVFGAGPDYDPFYGDHSTARPDIIGRDMVVDGFTIDLNLSNNLDPDLNAFGVELFYCAPSCCVLFGTRSAIRNCTVINWGANLEDALPITSHTKIGGKVRLHFAGGHNFQKDDLIYLTGSSGGSVDYNGTQTVIPLTPSSTTEIDIDVNPATAATVPGEAQWISYENFYLAIFTNNPTQNIFAGMPSGTYGANPGFINNKVPNATDCIIEGCAFYPPDPMAGSNQCSLIHITGGQHQSDAHFADVTLRGFNFGPIIRNNNFFFSELVNEEQELVLQGTQCIIMGGSSGGVVEGNKLVGGAKIFWQDTVASVNLTIRDNTAEHAFGGIFFGFSARIMGMNVLNNSFGLMDFNPGDPDISSGQSALTIFNTIGGHCADVLVKGNNFYSSDGVPFVEVNGRVFAINVAHVERLVVEGNPISDDFADDVRYTFFDCDDRIVTDPKRGPLLPTMNDGQIFGDTQLGEVGQDSAVGRLAYLKSDGIWYYTDADVEALANSQLGLIASLANIGDVATILLRGKMRADAAFPTLTPGRPLWLSTKLGKMQTAKPRGLNDVIRSVANALSETEIFFNPSHDYTLADGTGTIDLLDHSSGTAAAPLDGSVTTSPFDATAAEIIVVAVVRNSGGGAITVEDNGTPSSNAYTPLTEQTVGGLAVQFWYCAGADIVSASGTQTVTVTGTTCQASVFAAAFSGTDLSAPFDQESGDGTSQPGALTATLPWSLYVTVMGTSSPATYTPPEDFELLDQEIFVTGVAFGGALAWQVQVAGPEEVDPVWTPFPVTASAMAVFKPA